MVQLTTGYDIFPPPPAIVLGITGNILGGIALAGKGVNFALHTATNTYFGQRDDVCTWGYNVAPNTMSTRINLTEPQLAYTLESNYLTGFGGLNMMEHNLDYMSADGLTSRRFQQFQVDRAAHTGYWTFWSGAGLETLNMRTGRIGVGVGGSNPAHYFQQVWTDANPAGFGIVPGTWAMQNLNATNGNCEVMYFLSADATIAAGILVENVNHTNHYGQIKFASRGPVGFATTNLVIYGNNVGLGTEYFAGGCGVLAIREAQIVPAGALTTGLVLYCEGGVLKYIDTAGVVRTIDFH